MRRLLIALLTLTLCACASKSATDTSHPAAPTVQTFTSEADGFAINFPLGWTMQEHVILATDDAEYTGTAFTPPMPPKSLLLEAQVNVSVKNTCTPKAGGAVLNINGKKIYRNKWNGAAAGSLYRGETYQIEHNERCGVIVFYEHSCNLGPDCGPDHSEAFDHDALFKTFRGIMSSLHWL